MCVWPSRIQLKKRPRKHHSPAVAHATPNRAHPTSPTRWSTRSRGRLTTVPRTRTAPLQPSVRWGAPASLTRALLLTAPTEAVSSRLSDCPRPPCHNGCRHPNSNRQPTQRQRQRPIHQRPSLSRKQQEEPRRRKQPLRPIQQRLSRRGRQRRKQRLQPRLPLHPPLHSSPLHSRRLRPSRPRLLPHPPPLSPPLALASCVEASRSLRSPPHSP